MFLYFSYLEVTINNPNRYDHCFRAHSEATEKLPNLAERQVLEHQLIKMT